jgi:energy-coupling factor transport system substrate-specific component
MAGFWASRGIFQFRSDDARAGGFLSLAAGFAAAAVLLQIVQATIGLKIDEADTTSQVRVVAIALVIIVVGVVVAWITGRTAFDLKASDPRIRSYLIGATAIAAFAIVFGLFRLLFSPSGYFSGIDGVADDGSPDPLPIIGTISLTGLALPDPAAIIVGLLVALLVGFLAFTWASRGEHARLFPVWVGGATTGVVAAIISAPIAAGVFGGVTGGGTDALVAVFRSLGLDVLPAALAQGLTVDPLDKTISFTVVFLILGALPVTVRTMYSRGEATVVE